MSAANLMYSTSCILIFNLGMETGMHETKLIFDARDSHEMPSKHLVRRAYQLINGWWLAWRELLRGHHHPSSLPRRPHTPHSRQHPRRCRP